MPRELKKFKIELNSAENLRDLLQNIIELTDEQIKQSQDEINKLKTSTTLTEEAMDGKAKYAKAVNDFMAIKDKAMAKRIEVARLLDEVIKHNGDISGDESGKKQESFSLDNLRKLVDDTMSSKDKAGETKTITLKKQ